MDHPITIAQRGFDVWKDKEHNAKWFRKIDGTPIPNDLVVCIAMEFVEALKEAQRPEPDWRPIRTAPKMETIIVAGGDALYPVTASWDGDPMEGWHVDGQEDTHCEIGWPTHWMPLPAFSALDPSSHTAATASPAARKTLDELTCDDRVPWAPRTTANSAEYLGQRARSAEEAVMQSEAEIVTRIAIPSAMAASAEPLAFRWKWEPSGPWIYAEAHLAVKKAPVLEPLYAAPPSSGAAREALEKIASIAGGFPAPEGERPIAGLVSFQRITELARAALSAAPVSAWQESRIDPRHFSILVEAMAEVKAVSDGKSDQPLADIVSGCLVEIDALPRNDQTSGGARS